MNYRTISIITIVFTTFTFYSCKTEKKDSEISKRKANEFLLLGTVKNIADSTWAYLRENNKNKDSVLITNEQFKLKGSVAEPVFNLIRIQNDYIYLWIENEEIEIIGEKGNLKNAKITGGETQKQSNVLKQRTDSINKEFAKLQEFQMSGKVTAQNNDSIQVQQKAILSEINNIDKTFITDFPDSYISGSTLIANAMKWNNKEISELYNGLSEKIKKSKDGKSVAHLLSLPEKPKVGDKFVDFELLDTNDKPVKLSDIKGKYVLVEFWASWCGPCRQSNPKLVENYNTYKSKGLEIIGVSLDQDKKSWLQAIEKDKLPWTNVIESKHFMSDLAQIYRIQGIPDNFIIDKNGILVAQTLRGPQQVEKKLKELFQ